MGNSQSNKPHSVGNPNVDVINALPEKPRVRKVCSACGSPRFRMLEIGEVLDGVWFNTYSELQCMNCHTTGQPRDFPDVDIPGGE